MHLCVLVCKSLRDDILCITELTHAHRAVCLCLAHVCRERKECRRDKVDHPTVCGEVTLF